MKYLPTRRRVLFSAGLVILFAAPRLLRAQAGAGAVAPIREFCDKLLDVMKAGQSAPFNTRFDMLAPVIDRVFDLTTILQNSVGASWGSLSPADQEALTAAFRQYTIASYVNSFDHYSGQRFEVLPDPQQVQPGQLIVRSRIIPQSGSPHELNYVMRSRGSTWKVVDVLADGSISQVARQRSDFRGLLASGGAPALAKRLQQKSADLSAGAK
ncbi:MAG: ABC transporter substrate-binding protein [Acetobacteraceae bacterium]|nr:ABC transporter substrate-binding protein [Acetobacteraceae bacterium]